jgi:hypothetical protein
VSSSFAKVIGVLMENHGLKLLFNYNPTDVLQIYKVLQELMIVMERYANEVKRN